MRGGGGGVCMAGGRPCQGAVYHVTYPKTAFDVTCMLSPHQLRVNTNAAAFILLGTPPPLCCEQND